VWVRRGCALVVAAVAAYSSYAHQRHFALAGGVDQVSAALWPLSVDGLVVLASLGLVRAQSSTTTRARLALWCGVPTRCGGLANGQHRHNAHAELAAGAGRGVAAAGAAASGGTGRALSQPKTRRRRPGAARDHVGCRTGNPRPARSTRSRTPRPHPRPGTETAHENQIGERLIRLPRRDPRRLGNLSAEAVMWAHFETQRKAGPHASGAELDRVAGTNYGRAVLVPWRDSGRIPTTTQRTGSGRVPAAGLRERRGAGDARPSSQDVIFLTRLRVPACRTGLSCDFEPATVPISKR
jgi:Protein of unknown function (DUF2637)